MKYRVDLSAAPHSRQVRERLQKNQIATASAGSARRGKCIAAKRMFAAFAMKSAAAINGIAAFCREFRGCQIRPAQIAAAFMRYCPHRSVERRDGEAGERRHRRPLQQQHKTRDVPAVEQTEFGERTVGDRAEYRDANLLASFIEHINTPLEIMRPNLRTR
jgi:hypothetical protein